MSTYEDMIDKIVKMRLALMADNMQGGCCPHAVYPLKGKAKQDVCGDDCLACYREWRKQKVQEVWEEVREEMFEQFDKKKEKKWAFVEKDNKVYVKDMDTVIEEEKIIGWSKDIRTACNKARKHANQGLHLEYIKRACV